MRGVTGLPVRVFQGDGGHLRFTASRHPPLSPSLPSPPLPQSPSNVAFHALSATLAASEVKKPPLPREGLFDVIVRVRVAPEPSNQPNADKICDETINPQRQFGGQPYVCRGSRSKSVSRRSATTTATKSPCQYLCPPILPFLWLVRFPVSAGLSEISKQKCCAVASSVEDGVLQVRLAQPAVQIP